MIPARGYAAHSARGPLAPFAFERREVKPTDVLIDILYCGICHSDIHTVRDEWGHANYPVVPGHEIAGRVRRVGSKVKKFKVGDSAGVGCFVESCRQCPSCKAGEEQFCEKGCSFTYNGVMPDGKTKTQGGYSSQIVVDENYALRIAQNVPLERVAPLLCAGITTYSPLNHWKLAKGQRLGVIGLGGLGHMAVKFGVGMGAEVTVFSRSRSKEKDARALGAEHYVAGTDEKDMRALSNHFDLIINTVSAVHALDSYISLLGVGGKMIIVGASPDAHTVQAFSLIMGRRVLAGSLIGGIVETQEMLDWCAKKKVFSDVEVIPASKINEAYDRVVKGDVRYRFVIDLKTL